MSLHVVPCGTLRELYDQTAVAVRVPGPGKVAFPWTEYTHSRDVRQRLVEFEKSFKEGKVEWCPFNDSVSNDGPMSINSDSGRALAERYTNAADGLLELMARLFEGTLPITPREAAELWYGITEETFTKLLINKDGAKVPVNLDELASKFITIEVYAGKSSEPTNTVVDIRDFGIGLSSEEMPGTILSLNRGNKRGKSYLSGKHGQGSSNTFQFSDITLIVCRKVGSSEVAFTFVDRFWDDGKTPTYRYLTIDGKVPTLSLSEKEFPHGVLVRHIGYNSTLYNPFGENSVYGLLQRTIPRPLFPVEVIHHAMTPPTKEITSGKKTVQGGGDRHVLKGTVHTLLAARQEYLNKKAGLDYSGRKAEIPYSRYRVSFDLGKQDMGGRTGEVDLGTVSFNIWVTECEGRKDARDALRNWVLPEKPILFTLDGQTHSEEQLRYLVAPPANGGAGLWAVGRWMVVEVNCDRLSREARYELFTSTREQAKDTPLKHRILQELVAVLKKDEELIDLNIRYAKTKNSKSQPERDADYADKLKKYLRDTNLVLPKVAIQVEREVDETYDTEGGVPKRTPAPPIPSQETPTFLRWKANRRTFKVYAGQKCSCVLETDAPPVYWDPIDMTKSAIRVMPVGNNIRIRGTGGDMKGGRISIRFECDENAVIGSRATLEANIRPLKGGSAFIEAFPLEIEVVPRAEVGVVEVGAVEEGGTSTSPGPDAGTNLITKTRKTRKIVTVMQEFLRPEAVEPSDSTLWYNLGWDQIGNSGMAIQSANGWQVYYNAGFPALMAALKKFDKLGLKERYFEIFELKLVLHAIAEFNHQCQSPTLTEGPSQDYFRRLMCAIMEDTVRNTEIELEKEMQLIKEEAKLA